MSKVFRITPKRTKRVNGQVITPEMLPTSPTRLLTKHFFQKKQL